MFTIDLDFKYEKLLSFLNDFAPFKPNVAIILGSGAGDFIEHVEIQKTIKTDDLPGYPVSTVEGHHGAIHFCRLKGETVLLFQGRIHYYEGYSIDECILPVYIAKKMGCKELILTNAAGGINQKFAPGDLMLATSFNGMFIKKQLTKLIGLAEFNKRNSFSDFPTERLNETIRNAAVDLALGLREGVYWYTTGPTYETPSEVKMMGAMGADAVGMSTVHEAVVAKYLGMEVSSISTITNFAAGLSPVKLSHEEVQITARLVKELFCALLEKTVELLKAQRDTVTE